MQAISNPRDDAASIQVVAKDAASPRSVRVLAWSLILLGLLLLGATIIFMLLGGASAQTEGEWTSTGWLGALFLSVPGIAFLAVGGLLAVRLPKNPIGWLCLTIALLWLMVLTSDAVAQWAVYHDLFAVAAWLGLVGTLWVPALGLTGTHLPLRLPDGHLLSPRWRWFSWFCSAAIFLTFVVALTEPGRLVASLPETENPLASEAIQSFGLVFIAFIIGLVGGIGSLVVRYRRAGGVERVQLRWITYGGALCVAMFVITVLLTTLFPEPSWLGVALGNLTTATYAAIPISIGIAVLRYRLYNVDLLINRTLIYVPLTVILAVLFAIAQKVSDQFLTGFWGENSVAGTLVTTFVLVALFEPLRRSIERLVDKYVKTIPDPARTVKTFRKQVESRTLRVNSETLAQQLLEEMLLGFGATSGAVYLGGEVSGPLESLHPLHATRNWTGQAEVRIPLRSAEGKEALGVVALGPPRWGGEYSTRQHQLLQEMAQIATAAIEQDQPIAPRQPSTT